MIATILTSLATLASSSRESPTFLLAAGPASGVAVYFFGFRYYRNTQRSHSFERETRISSRPVTGSESKIGENNGTRNSSIEGGNHSDHRRRVRRE